MATFNAQQNNSRDKVNVNTRGFQFMNKNGFDPSALSVGFWNDFVSFRINPALEPSQQTETRVFDYDKAVSTALTPRHIIRILKGIDEYIKPAIETGENHSISVQVGGDSLVTVGTGTKYTDGNVCQYFAIHKEVDPATKKPAMSIFYEFSKDNLIMDYEEKTGAYTVNGNIADEFELFIQFLKYAVLGMTKAVTHGDRVVNRYNNEKLQTNIEAIGVKVGASLMTSNSTGYRSNRGSVDFSNNGGGSGAEYEAALANLSDLSDLG